MKKISFLIMIALTSTYSFAQTARTKQQKLVKQTANKKAVYKTDENINTSTVVFMNNSTYYAHGTAGKRLTIADPTINRLNQYAAGLPVPSKAGLPGVAKGTYGFANGKIFLRNTTANSSGTNFSSGAVGTGTSINGIGTSETTIGVNGKAPYAGPGLWGTDTTRKQ